MGHPFPYEGLSPQYHEHTDQGAQEGGAHATDEGTLEEGILEHRS
jgi:hypothetical protein